MDEQHRHDREGKKKVRPTTREYSTALYHLRAVQLGLSVDDMEQITMGMVVDMETEASNDQAEYAYKATQADINALK